MPPFKAGLIKRKLESVADKVTEQEGPAPGREEAAERDVLHDTNTAQPVLERDEYSSGDTSDEEGGVCTAGGVPRHWYAEYQHVDYDTAGRRVLRAGGAGRDAVDEFLRQCAQPEYWRTVRDPRTQQDIVLSASDLRLIGRLRARLTPGDTDDSEAQQPWVEWFTREVLAAPLRAFPDHKRSFLPSRDEARAVGRLVHALRMGWAKTRRQLAQERWRRRQRQPYDLWGSADEPKGPRAPRLPAPRRPLPGHAESYNPPPEYLLDDKEMKEWQSLSATPWQRKYSFLPTAHASLRAVPAYARYTRERFLRCLDLYLAPRATKMRLTIGPEALVPSLPSPRELQPFPTREALCLRGHTAVVRACSVDPAGQYAVSGAEDGTVKIWELSSGRCLRTIALDEGVSAVAWSPAGGLALVAAAAGARLLLLSPGASIGAHRTAQRTDLLLAEGPPAHDERMDARTAAAVQWAAVGALEWARGVRLMVQHTQPLTSLSWHARGDYVAVTTREAGARAVLVHQVSRRRSQLPLKRARGLVQAAVWHPSRPHLLVATQRAVRVYDLLKQTLVRKLETGAQWVSALAVHPGGEHVLVVSYDRKAVWFDLELSSRPYRTLRLHGGAVRAAAFHARYPLFATAGDDSRVVVSHGRVYADLLTNALLVPLKALPAPPRAHSLCVTALAWHPTQPWLLAAGADSTLRLYT